MHAAHMLCSGTSGRVELGQRPPIAASFQPGKDWRWCYADEALV